MNAALIVALWAVTLYVLVRDARPRPTPAPAPELRRWTLGNEHGEHCATVEADTDDDLLECTLLALTLEGYWILDREREGQL